MTKPQNIVTKKDATYLADTLGMMLMYAKKCRHYSEIAVDESIVQVLEKTEQKIKKYYNELLEELNNE